MLGIIFIYWIWKSFSNLAYEYDKNKWTFFFIGLGSYYGITFLSAIIFVMIKAILYGAGTLDAHNSTFTMGMDILFAGFGGLGCYGVYKILESQGEKQRETSEKDEIDSIGLGEGN